MAGRAATCQHDGDIPGAGLGFVARPHQLRGVRQPTTVVIRGIGFADRLANSWRAAGSRRAQDSRTPTASRLATRAEPPYESSGSGTPAIGSIRSTTARLISA